MQSCRAVRVWMGSLEECVVKSCSAQFDLVVPCCLNCSAQFDLVVSSCLNCWAQVDCVDLLVWIARPVWLCCTFLFELLSPQHMCHSAARLHWCRVCCDVVDEPLPFAWRDDISALGISLSALKHSFQHSFQHSFEAFLWLSAWHIPSSIPLVHSFGTFLPAFLWHVVSFVTILFVLWVFR